MAASRVLLLALVAAAAAAVAEGAQARIRLQPSPDHPGKCYIPEEQLVLAPGDTLTDKGACVERKCLGLDNAFEIVISSCGSINVPSGCALDTPSPDSPYPQCCPTVKC